MEPEVNPDMEEELNAGTELKVMPTGQRCAATLLVVSGDRTIYIRCDKHHNHHTHGCVISDVYLDWETI